MREILIGDVGLRFLGLGGEGFVGCGHKRDAGGGVGEISEQTISGFLRAAAVDRIVKNANASAAQSVTALTFLAGAAHAGSTREGIEKAISSRGR